MEQVADLFEASVALVQINLHFLLVSLAGLWIINLVNWILLRGNLNIFGLYPRSIPGLIGIFTSPILHADFNHLFFNSIPLFFLAAMVLLGGKPLFFDVTVAIVVISGGLLWLFGRRAIHIGASGVLMGYWGYMLITAYLTNPILLILLAILTLYYFIGLFAALIPGEKGASWEGHVFGFIAGIAAAFYYHFDLSTII